VSRGYCRQAMSHYVPSSDAAEAAGPGIPQAAGKRSAI
jgi:hypothetical protein